MTTWLTLMNVVFQARLRSLLFAMAGLVLLASCTTPVHESFDAQFERAGRFVVQVNEPGGTVQSVQGGFRWRQNEQNWQLDLVSPLGAILARLEASPSGVVLLQSGEAPRRAQNAAELVDELFAAQVPVDAMSDWIQGRVARTSDAHDIRRDDQDKVVYLIQDGWRISFDRYDDLGPRFIEVSGQDQAREVMLRMIVDGS